MDAGIGWVAPGSYMYAAHTLTGSFGDEEHDYFAHLLAGFGSKYRRRNLAQVAFAEKNVFPCLGDDACFKSECPSLHPVQCHFYSLATLAMAGPLAAPWEPPDKTELPVFDIFAPRGALYDPWVRIEYATDPSFTGAGDDWVHQYQLDTTAEPVINNSPAGFFRHSPEQASQWNQLVVLARLKDPKRPRIYYRVQQCQNFLGNQFNCVWSSLAGSDTVPYVIIGESAVQIDLIGCSSNLAGRVPSSPWAWLGALVALGLWRRRQVARVES